MSDEGWVTPSGVVSNITPQEVTPDAGKGALGAWRCWGETSAGYKAWISWATKIQARAKQ